MGHKANKKLARLRRSLDVEWRRRNLAEVTSHYREQEISDLRAVNRKLERRLDELMNARPLIQVMTEREPYLGHRTRVRLDIPPFEFAYVVDERAVRDKDNGARRYLKHALEELLDAVRREGEKQLGLK